jgi:hypothetical protein
VPAETAEVFDRIPPNDRIVVNNQQSQFRLNRTWMHVNLFGIVVVQVLICS